MSRSADSGQRPGGAHSQNAGSPPALPDDWDRLFDMEEVEEAEVVIAEHVEAEEKIPATRHLGFRVGGERYAVPILELSEVVKAQEVTRVPRVRSFVRGVFSVRGTIVPIIDLRRRLLSEGDEPRGEPDDERMQPPEEQRVSESNARRILITVQQGEPFGLLVDEVSDVFSLELHEIEPPPATLPRRVVEFVSGIARVQGLIHTLLDLPALLRFDAVNQSGPEGGA